MSILTNFWNAYYICYGDIHLWNEPLLEKSKENSKPALHQIFFVFSSILLRELIHHLSHFPINSIETQP